MDALTSHGESTLDTASWVEQRLSDLRREIFVGEARLEELEQERAQVRNTLLRIGGAIQVLEELRALPAFTSPQVSAPDTELVNGQSTG